MVVMVVEDNPVSARLLEGILHAAGHDVVTAASRSAALALVGSHGEIHLVVCDIELPDGSGLDLVVEMKSNPTYARVPVIMCTGADDPQTVRAAIDAGCASYLLKPVNAARLLDRVAACLPAAAQAPSP